MRILKITALLLVLLPATAMAQVENRLRLEGIWSNPTGDLTDQGVTLEADDAFGVQVAWEFLFTPSFGVEVAAATSEHEVTASGGGVSVDVGDLRVTPVTASLLYHFTPGATADFYVGGGAAYVNYGDVDSNGFGTVEVDDDFTFTVQAGVDVSLGGAWGLTGGVQYIDTEAEDEVGDALGIEPVIVSFGAVLRF